MIFVITMMWTVPKLQLREQCFSQDICADVNAQCIQGVCACVAGSRQENNTCCTLYSMCSAILVMNKSTISMICLIISGITGREEKRDLKRVLVSLFNYSKQISLCTETL